MQFDELERLFSKSRLDTYYRIFPNDKEKAISYYQLNIQISEALYPLLSSFEIVLRNSIHNSFSIHFKSENWFEQIKYPELIDQINIAKSKIALSNKAYSIDKLVSELTLGFWTMLLNKKYAKDFWKPLMFVFPMISKEQKQRSLIAYKLNNTRKFRNRIFHFEPICNDLKMLSLNHQTILELLKWINTDIVLWTSQIDRFEILFEKIRQNKPS
ncbi:MAG: hypothetical protein KA734_01500 [Fluviicola sp.]|nr:hypothetical protein [Fluviicola sp.]MBP6271736.1 hypothetical protein [Fluviicola sp.]